MIKPIVERAGDELKINLFPKQADFINSDVDDILFGGAASGGKSAALLVFAALRRMNHPGSNGLMLRRTFAQLEKSLILRSREIYPLFGATYNDTKKVWNFPNGSREQFGYLEKDADVYSYHCFHPETEILTMEGWKLIENVKAGDLAATMNPKTRYLEYQPVTKTWSYDYNGKMVYLYQKNGSSFCVTPNHKIWASTEKNKELRSYEASKLPLVVKIPQTLKWEGIVPPNNTFSFQSDGHNGKSVSFNAMDWCKFLGWYLSEGCIGWSRWQVRISQTKEKTRQEIIDLLEKNEIKVYKEKKGASFASKELCLYLSAFGKDCYSKRIPPDVKLWKKEYLFALLETIILGDGTWYRSREQATFVTSSIQLKDDVVEIAMKCGYKVTQKLVDGFLTKGKTKIWRVYLSKKDCDTSVRSNSYGIGSRPSTIDYSGQVHCVTVEPYHMVLTRFKDRISWSGQSDEYHDICFDEASLFNEFQINYMTSRCRSTLPNCKALIRLASNPGNVGHMFLKKRYIKPSEMNRVWKDEQTGKTYSFISAKIDDNPAITELDPGYKDRLKVLGEQKYLALAEGNWDVHEGQYFDYDLRIGYGVLPYRRVPESDTYKFVSMDWGYKEPAAVHWWEIMPSGRIFIYRELYVTQLSPKLLASRILEMTPTGEKLEYIACPPDIWGKETELEGGGESIHHAMQGVWGDRLPIVKAPNARVPGWTKLRDYFTLAGDGRPWMQISPVCENIIRTLPTMMHDEKNPEDASRAAEDHACVVGSTMLTTKHGDKTIEELCGTEGEVWTDEGWKNYTGVQKTKENVDVFKMTLTSGESIIATDDHRFMTPDGWKKIRELNKDSIVVIQSGTWKLLLSLIRFKDSMEKTISSVVFTSKEKALSFIEMFGNSTMVKFPRVCTSTIVTMTDLITPLRICNALHHRSITRTIPRLHAPLLMLKNLSKKLDLSQVYGMEQKKEENGTVEMLSNHGRKDTLSKKFVSFVERNTRLGKLLDLTTVISIAKCVRSAFATSKSSVLTIDLVGQRDVYNLCVNDIHRYFANGSLISGNCDSLRYGSMTIQNTAKNMSELISPYERLFGINSQSNKNQSFLPTIGKGGYGR